MKSKLHLTLVIAILAVASVFCLTVFAQKKQSPRVIWEYKVVSSAGDNQLRLSELGREGWELTSVRTEEEMLGNFRQTKVYYYLKRSNQIGK